MSWRDERDDRDERFGGGGGIAVRGTPIAALISLIGLLIIGAGTLAVFTGRLPFLPGGGGGDAGGAMTPAPSNVVVVDPRSKIPGSIVYAKAGNIWLQTGSDARQLTDGGDDAMPTWSADGTALASSENRSMLRLTVSPALTFEPTSTATF